jgi:CheY-like chemotaxis protein
MTMERDNVRRSVLVVEDSDEDWDTACEAARKAGFDGLLERARDGDACLERLHRPHADPHAADAALPALVLLDLNLPGVGGREVLAAIRGDERLRALPVVVCSTSSDPGDIDACYAGGVNAFQVKPLRHGEHLQALDTLFVYWLATATLPPIRHLAR